MYFQVDGLDDLIRAFDDLANLPDAVTDEMLSVQADLVVEAQKRTASTMLQGPYYAGGVAGAVTKSRVKKTSGGKAVDVEFKGTQHGESLARIAYINEYGKTNQPARPFIKTANEQAEGPALAAAQKVYDDYLKSKNL